MEAATVAMIASGIGTGLGVVSSIQTAKTQSAQAKYQADVARQNQELAEQQASAERRQGYENMVTQRQETAKLIGRQRAAAGASGATVDVGSNLDLQADTAFQGEIDAVNAYNKGIDTAYNSQIQAWNYGQQADAYDATAESTKNAGYLNAASTAIGGIADIGTTWAKFNANKPTTQTKYWDRALGKYVSNPVRH